MRKLVLCLAVVAAALAGPAAAGAHTQSDGATAVALHTLIVPGGVPVVRGEVPTASADGKSTAAIVGLPSLSEAGRAQRTLDAGRRFTMLGVLCTMPADGAGVTLRLRTSPDGRRWSGWLEAPLELAAESGGRVRAFTEPVWTGAARYAQIVAAGDADAPQALAGVRLVALDTTSTAAATAPATRAATTSREAARRGARPPIVTRSQWGADESWRGTAPDYAKIRLIVIHNTAGSNDYTQAEAPGVVRGVYAYHTRSLGWNDIAYNFLVDRFGTIYEGRAGGMTRGVVGAHVLGFNTGSSGISLMGNFNTDAPPPAALDALDQLLAWKLRLHKLKPLGTTKVRCLTSSKYRAGTLVTLPVIVGHRQVNNTDCPGGIFFPLLPLVRLEAAGKPQPPVIALARASAGRFSPNGDGVLDAVDVRLSLTRAAGWSVTLRSGAGRTLDTFCGEGAVAHITWRGVAGGRAYPDGSYTAVIAAESALGKAAPKKLKITIDTTPPQLGSLSVSGRRFSPNGDGWTETARIKYQPAESCATRVAVIDEQGKVRRRLTDWNKPSAAPGTAVWNGVFASGATATESTYRFKIEARDAAGNTSSTKTPVTVDNTVGFLAAAPAIFSPNADGVSDVTALGFTLTRPATVSVRVKLDGRTIRVLSPGELPAGAHLTSWDGRTAAGVTVGSARPTFTVRATSALGTSTASGALVVDLEAPVLSAPTALSVPSGQAARLSCTVQDPFSPTVILSYTITDAAGVTVGAGTLPAVPVGKAATWTWTPPAPGLYTVTYGAVDLAGNRAAAPAVTMLTAAK